jgi:hypothetical protein
MAFSWTAEKLAEKSLEDVKSVRENALKKGEIQLVELCDADLARRRPQKVKMQKVSEKNGSRVIHGFHFVCHAEHEVANNPDGTVTTGTWVVKPARVGPAVKIGAYVALHEAKSKASYLQGIIRSWREQPRQAKYGSSEDAKTKFGIEFVLEPSDQPLPWRGDGAGERGYYYGDDTSGQ